MGRPEISSDIKHQYLERVVSTLEETVTRMQQFGVIDRFLEYVTNKPDGTTAFNEAATATYDAVNVLLADIGGLPLSYTDSRTDEATATTVFICRGYDLATDTWTMIATDHGQPPMPFSPIREVNATTPELRTGFEAATLPLGSLGYPATGI